MVAHADLVVLQPLSPDEAQLIGLAEGREWLSRIPAGTLGFVPTPVPDRPPFAGPCSPDRA
jgi:hypothetical protein